MVALAGLALLGVGVWATKRSSAAASHRLMAAACVCIALAAFAAALFVQAFRHFGGTQEVGQGGSGYVCAPWWMEIDSRSGITDGDYVGPAPACRQAAVGAVPTAVLQSGAVGLVAGGLCALWLYRGRRRSASHPAGLAHLST